MKERKGARRSIIDSSDAPTPGEVLRAALTYRQAGLSLIPIEADQSKQPAFNLLPRVESGSGGRQKRSWGSFRDRQPTAAEIRDWFGKERIGSVCGMAILGGKVSGNLEILDVDKYDLVEGLQAEIEKRVPGLFDRLVKVRSPRPGMHLYYRCDTIGGNQKLARIADPTSPTPRPKTVIEIKGEGGYCLAPPSPCLCHPTGSCYCFVGDKDLTQVPTISAKERVALHDSARTFDLWQDLRRSRTPRARPPSAPRAVGGTIRPGDDFNDRAKWADILLPHGWIITGDDGGEVDYWRRPGKSGGNSATTNHYGNDLFHVFTSNADPFEQDVAYSKFHAYTLLEHDGNFDEAANALRRKGYGKDQVPRRLRSLEQKPPYTPLVLRSRRQA